jgi:antitoxin HicB
MKEKLMFDYPVTLTPDEGTVLAPFLDVPEKGMKKAELARRLGWHMPQVDRLFDLKHASNIEQIEAAAGVLDKRVLAEVG